MLRVWQSRGPVHLSLCSLILAKSTCKSVPLDSNAIKPAPYAGLPWKSEPSKEGFRHLSQILEAAVAPKVMDMRSTRLT